MDGLTFLEKPSTADPLPIYVVHGDEDFVKRKVVAALRKLVFGEAGDEFGLSIYDGDKAQYSDIQNELQTLAFLGSRRLILVDNADPFISAHRAALEKMVTQPSGQGILVMVAKSFPANTRLAKLINPDANLACKAMAPYRLPAWCVQWATVAHGKKLSSAGAQLLVDQVGVEMGLLDMELAKLAIFVGDKKSIDTADVDQLVNNSRTENTFKVFDAIGQGQVVEALGILNRCLDQGEDAMRILGAFSMQLRRLAQAARLTQQGISLGDALVQVGVPPFSIKGCTQQIRHLGRRRLDRVYDWLLEVDQGLKGGSQLPPRTLLEKLVIRLARPNAAIATGGSV